MLPSYIVTTQDNYNNTEEEGVGADTPDSLDNTDDTGAFPSDFSCWTSFWCWFVLGLSAVILFIIIILVVLSFKKESLTANFLIDKTSSVVTILTPVVTLIRYTKGLFRKRRLVIEEENLRIQSSQRPRSSSLLEL